MGIVKNPVTRAIWKVSLKLFRFCSEKSIALCRKIVPTSSRWIMFESEIDFAESARVLYEYMIEHGYNKRYTIVWSVQDPKRYPQKKNVIFIKRNVDSIRWNYCLNRCKYFIFTHPWWLQNWKPDQYVINVWHGNPFKAPGASKLKNVFNVILASSEDGVPFRRNEFDGDFEIAVLGAPRNDWLYKKGDFLAQFADAKSYSKIIYSMPTFKSSRSVGIDGENTSAYGINVIQSLDELEAFNRYLEKKNVLFVCIIHHLQIQEMVTKPELSNIIYLCDEDYAKYGFIMNQMLTCADALITDYSGVFLDYILLDRPIAFYRNDIEKYTRGFAMEHPEEYLAGHLIYNINDLCSFVEDILDGRDPYKTDRKKVCNRTQKYQDDQNCLRFFEYFNIMR